MDKLQLEVLLKAIDQVTAPLKGITTGSKETAAAVRDAKSALKELEKQQGLIDAFRNTNRMLAITGNELKTAQQNAQRMAQEVAATEKPTKAMTKALEAAKNEVRELKDRQTGLIEKQQTLRGALDTAGISTSNLAAHQKQLNADVAAATANVEKQSAALKIHNERMRSVNAAQAEYRKNIELRNKLAVGGAVTLGAGIAMGSPIIAASKEYAAFEDAMLGVARQVEGAKDANGRYTQTYRDMAREIKAMSEQIPMAAGNIAQIVEAGARMGIQGKDNLLTYARLTATMSTAFDLPVEQVGENIAKLSQLYKVPIKDIHSLGDSINWLDDNAQSKGGDIIDVMQRMAGIATTLNMSYRDAAALGSTFLSLGSRTDVAGTASNAIMTNLAAATMQSKKFQEGMGMLGMNSQTVQSGMTKDATGTILKVLEAIKSLPEEQRIEAATRLFGKEFGDDVSKLAGNLGEYRRQLALVNDAKAKGSMDREMESRLQTQNAQYEMMKNTLGNLAVDIGGTLKPALMDLMQTVSGVLKGFRDWIQQHPALAATLVKIVAGIAILVASMGALAIGAAAILGPFAAIKLAMSFMGIAAPAMGLKFGLVTTAVKLLALAFLGNPIGLGITAIITAGVLLYKHWDTLLKKFAQVRAWFSEKLGFSSPSVNFSRPAPLALAHQTGAGGTSAVIHVHPSAGMNEKNLADEVAKRIAAHDREKAARMRSRFGDRE